MTNLIFSRKADHSFLSIDDVQAKAPAALYDGHSDGLSDRYGEVDTKQVIEIMQDYGFGITQAAQKKPRKAEARFVAEHLLSFAPRVDSYLRTDEARPEIVIYNSRNGLSSLKIFTGAFRFICSNGMIAGEGMMQKVRHTKTQIVGVEDAIRHSAEALPTIMDRIKLFSGITLTPEEEMRLAREAASLRWSEMNQLQDSYEEGSYADHRTLMHMARGARRREDTGPDLWSVCSRMQEHLIRGGIDVVSVTKKAPHGKYRVASPIRSVSENVRINRDLWDIAEKYAEAA